MAKWAKTEIEGFTPFFSVISDGTLGLLVWNTRLLEFPARLWLFLSGGIISSVFGLHNRRFDWSLCYH